MKNKAMPQYTSRKPRANYGSRETPRQCKCGYTGSKVNDTYKSGETIHRERICTGCGAKYKTHEKI